MPHATQYTSFCEYIGEYVETWSTGLVHGMWWTGGLGSGPKRFLVRKASFNIFEGSFAQHQTSRWLMVDQSPAQAPNCSLQSIVIEP